LEILSLIPQLAIVNTGLFVYTCVAVAAEKFVLVGFSFNMTPYLRRAVFHHLATAAARFFTDLAKTFYHGGK
jgi:hypothetical protein